MGREVALGGSPRRRNRLGRAMYTSEHLDGVQLRDGSPRPLSAGRALHSHVQERPGQRLDLRSHLAVLRRRVRLVAASVTLCGAAAFAMSTTSTPQYAASTELFVSTQNGTDVNNAYQGGLLSQQRVHSYAKLVSSPTVLKAVSRRLDLAESPEQLRSRITVDAPVNTVLITVAVVDVDPARAQQLVDVVAEEFVRLVRRLEAPVGTSDAAVQVRVVAAADLPTDPVSPNVPRSTGLGVALGLLLGIGGAFLREAMDNTLQTVEDVEQHIRAVPLGLIAHDPHSADRPLMVLDAPHSPRAEAFRHLRTNLQFVDVDEAPRSIVVTSSTAGEGKSTTSCNLAISLAQAGMRVCLVDGDLRRPRLASYLGLEGAVGLTNVLAGTVPLDDALQAWAAEGVTVLASGPIPPNPAELLGSNEMDQLLRNLEARFDLVLVDSAPVLPVTDTAVLSTLVSGTVVVARARRTTREQVNRTLKSLETVGGRVYGAVLVGADVPARDGYGYGYAPDVAPATHRRSRART